MSPAHGCRLPSILAPAAGLLLLVLGGAASLDAQQPAFYIVPALPTARDSIVLAVPYCIYPNPPTVSGHLITLVGAAVLPSCVPPLFPGPVFYALPHLDEGSYTVEAVALGTVFTYVFQVAQVTPPVNGLSFFGASFGVAVSFSPPGSGGGAKQFAPAVKLSERSGYFWFFDSSSPEVMVKMVDGGAVNGHFWVFISSLTDVAFTVSVTDAAAFFSGCPVPGAKFGDCTRTYTSPGGANRNFIDLAAF